MTVFVFYWVCKFKLSADNRLGSVHYPALDSLKTPAMLNAQ